MKKTDAEADTGLKVRVTSQDFKPGFDTNRRIADLLRVPPEEPVPDYCESPELTYDLLVSRCEVLASAPTASGDSVLLFDHLDGVCVASGACWAHTLASALLCKLEEKAKV